MDLLTFMQRNGIDGPQGLSNILPKNFTRQQIAQYLVGSSVPCLENALAIFLVTQGSVDFADLLPPARRKFLPKDKYLIRTVEWESDIIDKI